MRKLLFVCLLLLPIPALAQEPAALKSTPTPEVKTERVRPVILDKERLKDLRMLSLALENAQLKADRAIPAELKAEIKNANDALNDYWKSLGINPDDLGTKWQRSAGQNGDIILTPVLPEKKVDTPPKTP